MQAPYAILRSSVNGGVVGLRRAWNSQGFEHHPHEAGRLGRGVAAEAEGAARSTHVVVPGAGNCEELAGGVCGWCVVEPRVSWLTALEQCSRDG